MMTWERVDGEAETATWPCEQDWTGLAERTRGIAANKSTKVLLSKPERADSCDSSNPKDAAAARSWLGPNVDR